MARVKRAINGKKHRSAVLEQAQGYYGNRSRSFRSANEAVMHSLQYAYRDRRARKGDFRRLWIQRINAAARINGLSYSRLIAGLRHADITIDRKVLADLAVTDPDAFAQLVGLAKAALPPTPPPSGVSSSGTRASGDPASGDPASETESDAGPVAVEAETVDAP